MFSRQFTRRVLTQPGRRYVSYRSTPKIYAFDRIENPYFKRDDDDREAEIINLRQQLSSPVLDPHVEIFGFLGEKRWAFNNGATRPALEKYQGALTRHPKAEIAIILTCQSDQLAKELSLKTPRENFLVLGVKPPIITGFPIKGLDMDLEGAVNVKAPRILLPSDFMVYRNGQATTGPEIQNMLEELIKNLELFNHRG
ncbi:hypothetical protein T3H00_10715 [Pseudomonas fluorescens]|jgi:hypothetical protein|uniref:hypothetical protein n=1 Tax=Pseudomonas TaxID=286 RepID=UPI001A935987|nr:MULTISPECIES: hypothetical protein [Pseudomonas]MDZ5433127.1 hypothetical protein [Pseudomonas fluorescens]